MEFRDVATTLAAGIAGASVGAITAVGYPAILAVASAIVVTASCCSLLDRRDLAVEAGVASYAVLGLATLASGISPAYGPATGVALLGSAAIGLVALEIVSRAGATIHAAKTGEGPADGWRRFARALASAIDRWNGTRQDRLLLAAGPLLAIGLHVAVILAGTTAMVQAATLVPVAVAGFAVFPFDATVEYVAPGTSGAVLSAHAPAVSPTGAIAEGAAGITATIGSVVPDRDGGEKNDGGASTSDTSASGDAGASGNASPSASASASTGGTTGRTAERSASTGGADVPPASAAGPAADAALDPCQNCGAETDDRKRRFVVSEEDLRLVLCADCHANRIETTRSREACQGAAVTGAIADATRCDACRARGPLEAHPIVPLDAGGHRHPNNVLALCPTCHAAVDDHAVASGQTTVE